MSIRDFVRKRLRRMIYQYPSLSLLGEHAEKVCETVEELVQQVHDYRQGRPVKQRSEHISQLEHEADALKFQLRSTLPRSDSFLPVARSDLLEFLWQQDEIADDAQDAAGLLPLLQVEIPNEAASAWQEFLRVLLEGAALHRQMTHALEELLEKGFRKEAIDNVMEILKEMNVLEHRADVASRALIEMVYRQPDLDGFAKYHLIQVFLKMGDILDHMENAAGRIRIMVAR